MSHTNSSKQDYESRNIRTNIYSALWIIGWAAAWATTSLLLKYVWQPSELLSILSIVFNILIGVGMVLFYKRMITEMDDLQRKIQFDAMALSLAVAMVSGPVLTLMQVADYIEDAKIAYVLFLICVIYSAATLFGCFRYR